MRDAAVQKIILRSPEKLAEITDFSWNGNLFETQTLGIPIKITWPACEISPKLGLWHDLTILQYIANTEGKKLTGYEITLSAFSSGGLVRGASFDREYDSIIRKIGEKPLQTIRKAGEQLGGIELNDKSDLCFRFSFLPRLPIKLNLWLEDEDFPASGKLLFDSSAQLDFGVEAAGTAAGILLQLLKQTID